MHSSAQKGESRDHGLWTVRALEKIRAAAIQIVRKLGGTSGTTTADGDAAALDFKPTADLAAVAA